MITSYILILLTIFFILFYTNNNFKNKVFIFSENFSNYKNKIQKIFSNKDTFKIIKLNYIDTQNILKFLQTKFNYDNILIPKDIKYEHTKNNTYLFQNIEIIGIKYLNNIENKISNIINFVFIPNTNNTFISNQDLFGINGNFKLISIKNEDNNDNIINEKKNITKAKYEGNDTENIFNKVPDIIHLTSESEIEIDSIQETTEEVNHQYA